MIGEPQIAGLLGPVLVGQAEVEEDRLQKGGAMAEAAVRQEGATATSPRRSRVTWPTRVLPVPGSPTSRARPSSSWTARRQGGHSLFVRGGRIVKAAVRRRRERASFQAEAFLVHRRSPRRPARRAQGNIGTARRQSLTTAENQTAIAAITKQNARDDRNRRGRGCGFAEHGRARLLPSREARRVVWLTSPEFRPEQLALRMADSATSPRHSRVLTAI